MYRCNKCVTDKSYCVKCCENPKYAHIPKQTKFQEYIPICPQGYMDCILDPAYIFSHHPEWYKDLYGEQTPEEVIKNKESCASCKDGDCYDDEDK